MCNEGFSVLTSHVCQPIRKRKIFDPYGTPLILFCFCFVDDLTVDQPQNGLHWRCISFVSEPVDEELNAAETSLDQIVRLKGHSDIVTACSWSPNSGLCASGSVLLLVL